MNPHIAITSINNYQRYYEPGSIPQLPFLFIILVVVFVLLEYFKAQLIYP